MLQILWRAGQSQLDSLSRWLNLLTGREKTARFVQTFQVTECDGTPLKVLSLQDPSGLWCDFAIPANMADQLGCPTHKAIAEELLRDQPA